MAFAVQKHKLQKSFRLVNGQGPLRRGRPSCLHRFVYKMPFFFASVVANLDTLNNDSGVARWIIECDL